MRAQIRMLPDGRRMHLQDGPIDLIVEASGPKQEIEAAYHAAAARFVLVLDELCAELAILRQPVTVESRRPRGNVAQRMMDAVQPFAADHFITPMAAVAGAVAENILAAMTSAADLRRAFVNNGGDIALHLARGEQFVVGMVELDHPSLFGTATLSWGESVRGIATSGWQGRSFSLGIADAVTVLAETAAMADAAATILGNAVDLPGHAAIVRMPARTLAPDSDLGELLVTQAVGPLTSKEIDAALLAGERVARSLAERGLIHSAALRLKGETRIVAASTRRLVHA